MPALVYKIISQQISIQHGQCPHPSHSLFQERTHRSRTATILEIVPDIGDFPPSVGEQGRAHVIFTRLGEGPAADTLDGCSASDVAGSGAHACVGGIIQDFLHTKVH